MSDDAIALILAHIVPVKGNLLDDLVREDDILRLDGDLALLRLAEEVLEMRAAIHSLLVIRATKSVILLLVEEGKHVLLEAATRDPCRLDLIVVARAHKCLCRLEVGVDRGDHLAVALHQLAGTLNAREKPGGKLLRNVRLAVLPWDPFGEERDLHPLGSSLCVVAQRAIEVYRVGVILELLDRKGEHIGADMIRRGKKINDLEEVAPASIFRDERRHRRDDLTTIGGHRHKDPIPEDLGERSLSLAAANVAGLEKQDPEILKCGVVILAHLPELIELRIDLLSRCAADKQSVEDDPRIVDALSSKDIAALGADLDES